MGYLVAMEHTCYVILIIAFFDNVHIIGPTFRSIGTKLTNLENMQQSYVLFVISNILQPTSGSKICSFNIYFCLKKQNGKPICLECIA